jgi:hypothetical protein
VEPITAVFCVLMDYSDDTPKNPSAVHACRNIFFFKNVSILQIRIYRFLVILNGDGPLTAVNFLHQLAKSQTPAKILQEMAAAGRG